MKPAEWLSHRRGIAFRRTLVPCAAWVPFSLSLWASLLAVPTTTALLASRLRCWELLQALRPPKAPRLLWAAFLATYVGPTPTVPTVRVGPGARSTPPASATCARRGVLSTRTVPSWLIESKSDYLRSPAFEHLELHPEPSAVGACATSPAYSDSVLVSEQPAAGRSRVLIPIVFSRADARYSARRPSCDDVATASQAQYRRANLPVEGPSPSPGVAR